MLLSQEDKFRKHISIENEGLKFFIFKSDNNIILVFYEVPDKLLFSVEDLPSAFSIDLGTCPAFDADEVYVRVPSYQFKLEQLDFPSFFLVISSVNILDNDDNRRSSFWRKHRLAG